MRLKEKKTVSCRGVVGTLVPKNSVLRIKPEGRMYVPSRVPEYVPAETSYVPPTPPEAAAET